MIKELDYKEFVRGLSSVSLEQRLPLRAAFELTYRCNFQCLHCYLPPERRSLKAGKELSGRQVFSILEQMRDIGVIFVGFTGGEVFLRKDIFDILDYSKRLGLQTIVLTNASLIDEKTAAALGRLSLNKVDITVHAMDEKIFDSISGVRGSAEKVFRAIRLLRRNKVPFSLKSCGMQDNVSQIPKVNAFARKLGVIYRLDNELLPRLDGSKTHMRRMLSPKESYLLRRACYPEMFNNPGTGKKNGPVVSRRRFKESIFNCGVAQSHFSVDACGRMNFCTQIDYPGYDILRGGLAAGWQELKASCDRIKPPVDWECLSCDVFDYCCWCPARAYLNDGSFFSCDPYYRKQAQFTRDLVRKKKDAQSRV